MTAERFGICIVGAGMAGLACATRLSEAGLRVVVLDKGRGPGGRMSTRRAEIASETVSFDHGAQYFTARDTDFAAIVSGWERQGIVRRWQAAGDDAWVGAPAMNAPIKAMARDLDVRWNTRVDAISAIMKGWRVSAGSEQFDAGIVLVAIAAEQSTTLLADPSPELSAIASEAHSQPCWAVMAGFETALPIEEDALRYESGPIGWAARNSAKPARAGGERWVIHATPSRSRELIDMGKDEAAAMLLADFFSQTGLAPVHPVHLSAHRWLFAMADPVAGEPARFDPENAIGLAGDYLHSPRVEGAWISGTALAEAVLAPR